MYELFIEYSLHGLYQQFEYKRVANKNLQASRFKNFA
jgi:hypothetical protein